jgi:ATP-dependent DNA ligase I
MIEGDDDRPQGQQGCEDESAARDGEPSPEPRSSCNRATATAPSALAAALLTGGMTLLADVVAASREVTETSSRSGKVAILAELLGRLERDEIPVAVGFLAGVPRQGRVGVGYSTIYGIDTAPASRPSLTVDELDRAIAEVQGTTGSGSAAKRRQILGELLGRATEQETDFVKRLFTGELRQGALAGLMIDAIAKAAGVSGQLARRALMLSGDLTRTAEIAITEGEDGLRAVQLELFRPILPMLASTATSVPEAVASFHKSSVEWKVDGIRIQIHRRGDEVRIYTRNLNEITDALPGIVDAVRRLPVTQAVLDGEALWMGEDGPAAFQDTVSQLDRHAPPEGVVTFLFDVLHLDGEDLLDTPLEQRAARLEGIAPELRIPAVVTSDPAEAERVQEEALSAGHEGVVVKDAASLYTAGRRGKTWRKVKPVRTYDLVVLGAEWGHGRRQGWLSNLHLGARDPRSGELVMVGKTFKGMTDELLAWQTKELLARETSRRGIAVFVRPELVVEIALDGVQSSTRYPGGVALRFARVKRYRPDKRADEADTIDDLRALLPSRA